MYPKIIIVLTLLLALVGCGETRYYWTADHYDAGRFRREDAECKLIARNAAAGIQSNRSLSYTATTYNYGGYQTTDIKPDYMQEALNDINTGVQQHFEGKKVYELCMQSKGYYQDENSLKKYDTTRKNTSTNRRTYKVALGEPCVEHKDCAGEAMCSQANICISRRDWQAEANQRWIKNNGKKCKKHSDCAGDDMCGDISKVCVSRQQWAKEIEQKYR